jgi:hypothetical protein
MFQASNLRKEQFQKRADTTSLTYSQKDCSFRFSPQLSHKTPRSPEATGAHEVSIIEETPAWVRLRHRLDSRARKPSIQLSTIGWTGDWPHAANSAYFFAAAAW